MSNKINFAIGFLAGRPNVCNIINSYYRDIIKQIKEFNKDVEITLFILYDLEYMNSSREDFYSIDSKVYESNIKVVYISPEIIQDTKAEIISKFHFTKYEADLFVGSGYARARNCILYNALKQKMDYLFFWDDDEYPIANIKDSSGVIWKEQSTILTHLKNIENSDITVGYRCGNLSPLPYLEIDKDIKKDDYKTFIEAISNDVVSWDIIKRGILEEENSISFANARIIDNNEITILNEDDCIYGSGLCLNLNHLDKIPAFYNPPNARGEDTFFSMLLKDCKILKLPVYHFHDSFLKYTELMKKIYPNQLKSILHEDIAVETRFLNTTIGWIKYKPLLMYIKNKSSYKENSAIIKQKLQISAPKMKQVYKNCDFSILYDYFLEYDKNVALHYNEYLEVNSLWNRIKKTYKEVF